MSTPEFWQRVATDRQTACGIERARADAAESQRDALLAALQSMACDVKYLVDEGTLPASALEHPSYTGALAAIAACEVQS